MVTVKKPTIRHFQDTLGNRGHFSFSAGRWEAGKLHPRSATSFHYPMVAYRRASLGRNRWKGRRIVRNGFLGTAAAAMG